MLGIVIVSFGSDALLEQNLLEVDVDALSARVVVVDNARSPSSQRRVASLAEANGWDVLLNPVNLGFGAAMNQGAARAIELGCTELLLLNPDVTIATDILRALADHVAREPRAVVSPRITRPDGTPWFTGGVVDVRAGRTRNVRDGSPAHNGWLSGACLALHAHLWAEVGGFDPDYFLYWEDVDLSFRCVAAGGQLVVRQDLCVVHDVGGTQATEGRAKSAAYSVYNCRNRLMFAAKHLARRDVARWLLRTPGYARLVVLRGGRRQLLHSWRPIFDVSRGSLAGIRLALRALALGRV
jgi:GT2 family glycosyltransferase